MAKKGKPRGNPDKIKPHQWKPGTSGNPKGRPRREPMRDVLEAVLAERVPANKDPDQPTLAEVLIKNFVYEAIRTKDTEMVIEIFNRMDGKVKDRIELGGEDGEPIRVQRIDPKQFTDEELEEYERLVKKASGTGPERSDPGHES
jgi:hypothetical protein